MEIRRSSSSAAHSCRDGDASASLPLPSSVARRGGAGGRSVQPSSDSATSSPSGVARTHNSTSCSSAAAMAGRATAIPSLRARSAIDAICGIASVWPRLEPASRCSASSSGSALTSRPALSTRPSTGRGSLGALAISGCPGFQPHGGRRDRRRASCARRRARHRPARRTAAIAPPGSVRPRRSPIPASNPAPSSRRTLASRSSVMTRCSDADSSSSVAISPRRPERRASAWATKVISPSIAAETISSSESIPSSSSRSTSTAISSSKPLARS